MRSIGFYLLLAFLSPLVLVLQVALVLLLLSVRLLRALIVWAGPEVTSG